MIKQDISLENFRYRYTIEGIVFPTQNELSIETPFLYSTNSGDAIAIWTLKKSQIIANCGTQIEWTDSFEEMLTFRNGLRSSIEFIAGGHCIGYSNAFIIYLSHASSTDRKFFHLFSTTHEHILPHTANHDSELVKTFNLMATTAFPESVWTLKEAYQEFQRGIAFPDSSAMHFYRSIESVRNFAWRLKTGSLSYDTKNTINLWHNLYEIVGSDFKLPTESLREKAALARHGNVPPQSASERLQWSSLVRSMILNISRYSLENFDPDGKRKSNPKP